jgi:CRISPR-associated protein (TIGR03986 family)
MITVHGYVCVTNRNIDRKHDERVFFTNRSGPLYQPLTEVLCQQWKELITNYQTIHETERAAGRNCPPALNNSEWSRQVVGGPAERQLSAGTLCYAACRNATVTALYPVMISRRLFEAAPLLLLPPELRPATLLSQLSPADRVFGWVKQNGKGAYRGNLRVGPVTCVTLDAIINFPRPGLPLAILGQPKQQQARFYAARTNQGEAQVNRLSKEQAGYQTGKGLRGRKVYPHHVGLTDEYWNQPTEDRTQHRVAGHFQEYRRPHKPELEEYQDERGRSNTRLLLNSDGTYALMTGEANEQRDDQNRSVLGWVRQKAEFFFDLQVTNLSPVELGALLWLLSPEISFHRLGGGKPFGFGSVRLNIQDAETFLYNGRDWSRFYESLDAITLPQVDRQATITAFKQAIVAAYGSQGSTFEMVPFIRAFRRAAEGFTTGLPIHYPRARQPGQTSPVPPHPDGLAYEWFVTNDRTEHNQVIEGHALPDLVDQNGNPDPGLPVLDAPRRGG